MVEVEAQGILRGLNAHLRFSGVHDSDFASYAKGRLELLSKWRNTIVECSDYRCRGGRNNKLADQEAEHCYTKNARSGPSNATYESDIIAQSSDNAAVGFDGGSALLQAK